MVATVRVVYDGSLVPLSINDSIPFTGGRFIYFTASSLSTDEELEVGISCLVNLPTLNGTTTKLWAEIGTALSDSIIPLPSEIGDMPYDFFLSFGVGSEVSGFRAYVISSEDTLESIASQIEDLEAKLDALKATTDLINLNASIQNIALGILGTGLTPITGGITSAIPLLFSTTTFLPLPLP